MSQQVHLSHAEYDVCVYIYNTVAMKLFAIFQQDAAYLYDAFNILLDATDNAFLTIPNFTHIQHSCGKLQEWQYARTFQAILKEVNNTYNDKYFHLQYTAEIQQQNGDHQRYYISLLQH